MKDVLTQLLASKKFLAFIVTALVVVLSPIVGVLGFEVDPQKLALFVGAAAAYILSQGIADHGATAAKINAESAASMDPVVPHDTMAKDEPMVAL
ncbi:MAG: hypothetical protein H0X39_00825 [Actinobacteria bacterium]|nr:hypothetical protein [Actinomycetota bacterium]